MNLKYSQKIKFAAAIAGVAAVILSGGFAFLNFKASRNIALAGAGDKISGFARSENIGWISFNSIDCDTNGDGDIDSGEDINGCPATGTLAPDYGVNIDPSTGNFSGYAWSPNVGWISFNENNPPDDYAFNLNCPGICDSTNNCAACYDIGNGNVYGWAKVLSLGDDGWIKFKKDASDSGADYGAGINSSTGDFSGWAWNGNGDNAGIGWISFNCADSGAGGCAGSDYKVSVSGLAPSAPTNLTSTALDCSTIRLNWDHITSNETGFESEYSNDGISSWTTVPMCNPGQGVHLCAIVMPEGTTRYFRVRATGAGGDSDWEPSSGGTAATTAYCPPVLTVDANSANCDKLTLDWTYNNSGVDHYEIWRNRDSVGWAMKEASIPSSQTDYIDLDISSGSSYEYYVKAQTENIDSNITAPEKPCSKLPAWKEIAP